MSTILSDVLILARQSRKVGETRSIAIENAAGRAWRAVNTGDDTVLIVKDGPGITQVSQSWFQQAFENLFRNTVKHGDPCCDSDDDAVADDMPADETAPTESPSTDAADGLAVRVGPTETGFYVVDNGPEIPADERDTVFKHGHTTSDSGTGFGFSTVKSVIEAHGQGIEATVPEADLGGARFGLDIGGVRSEVEPWFSFSDD